MITWLPERYSIKNKYLKLKNKEGNWINGWQVVETYSKIKKEDAIIASQDYKNQRKESDV